MNRVELKFKNRAAKEIGFFLFKKSDALDFVKECEVEDLYIFGVNGFYIINDRGIQPSMANSIDLSSVPNYNYEVNFKRAFEFIESQPENLFFEIVCE